MATATQTNQAIDTKAGINSAYDANLAAQKQALLNAYNTNTAAQTQQGNTVREQAGTLGGDVMTQNLRNQQNLNQFADVRGLNRQQGSQAALSLGNASASAMGTMGAQKQAALAENQRQQDLLKMQYQADVASAIADNDYKRAAALLDDYKNQNSWKEQQAQILASYGNFDPYGQLYGQNAATQAKNVWLAQNPDVAYRTGQISADMYRNITGKWPAGYTPPSSGGIDWSSYRAPKKEDEEPIILKQSWQTQQKSKGPSSHSSSSHSSTPKATGGTTVNKAGFSGGSGKF